MTIPQHYTDFINITFHCNNHRMSDADLAVLLFVNIPYHTMQDEVRFTLRPSFLRIDLE